MGVKLYVCKLDDEALQIIDDVERYLIHTYGREASTRQRMPARPLSIVHAGDVPETLSKQLAAG
jgi:hypothetical protein